ncbi:hypothetical protein MGP2080_12407 [marine gamma proteobacterium HTCC2080]|jgi:hypothetical protein|nr:hypothetical protein MGP2080_12407 [marine gamma proteobacterium HTCC2080]
MHFGAYRATRFLLTTRAQYPKAQDKNWRKAITMTANFEACVTLKRISIVKH